MKPESHDRGRCNAKSEGVWFCGTAEELRNEMMPEGETQEDEVLQLWWKKNDSSEGPIFTLLLRKIPHWRSWPEVSLKPSENMSNPASSGVEKKVAEGSSAGELHVLGVGKTFKTTNISRGSEGDKDNDVALDSHTNLHMTHALSGEVPCFEIQINSGIDSYTPASCIGHNEVKLRGLSKDIGPNCIRYVLSPDHVSNHDKDETHSSHQRISHHNNKVNHKEFWAKQGSVGQ